MSKFIPLIALLILAIFLYIGLGLDNKKLPSALIGKSLPNIEVENFQSGKLFNIKDRLTGQITLINVWASWCLTCRVEHKVLMDIAQEYNIKIVGINYKDDYMSAKEFLEILGDPFSLIINDKNGILGMELGVYGVPESFLVDKNADIIFKHIGEINANIWQKDFIPILNKLQ